MRGSKPMCGKPSALFGIVLVLGLTAPSFGMELLNNGTFETGDLSGWSTANISSANQSFEAVLSGSTNTPNSLNAITPNTAGTGSYYALSDPLVNDALALLQSFTVSGSGTLTLTFDMFVNSQNINQPFGSDGTLQPNIFGALNQHTRVDILTASADPLSTAGGDVVTNLYLGVDTSDTSPNPNDFTGYSFDLTSILEEGQTYQIRFAQVARITLNTGIDNVSLFLDDGTNSGHIVPLPPAAFAGLTLLAGLGGGRWLKRRRNA